MTPRTTPTGSLFAHRGLCAACSTASTGGACPDCGTVWYRDEGGKLVSLGNAADLEAHRRWMQSLDDDNYIEAQRLGLLDPASDWRSYQGTAAWR